MLCDGIFKRGVYLMYVVNDFFYVPVGRVYTVYDLELSLALKSVVYYETTIGVCAESNCPHYVRDVMLRSVLCGKDVFRDGGLCVLCFVIL